VNPYFGLPLASGLVCLVIAVVVLVREPWSTASRGLAAILAGGAWWGCCDALWTLAPDPASALFLVRLSAPGWVLAAPLVLHVLIEQAPGLPRALRRLLLPAYGAAALFLALDWTTPWMHVAVFRVPWGWAYRPGPAYAAWYASTVLLIGAVTYLAQAGLRRTGSPAERRQSPWLRAGIGIPLVLGSATDGLLPLLGVSVPRLGPLSFAVFGVLITASLRRFGYSVLAPGSFAAPILSSLREGVALATPDGHIRFANRGLAALLGTSVAELQDEPVGRFLTAAPVAPPREIQELECEIAPRVGEPFPVALSTSLLHDRRGTWIGLVLVVRDLREVVGLRNRLVTSARLAAVGQLAAGIAHEINNPLAYIGANLRRLREQWLALAEGGPEGDSKVDFGEGLEEGLAMLEESLEGVERTAAIVREVRSFSHGGSDARERLDPNELVDRALRMAEPHVRGRIRVERTREAVPPVAGSRRELEQVLLNLIVNAAQAMGDDGTLSVATRPAGGEVELAITDTGCGIPPELLPRIFDPFFTTKGVGEGTGLGLSISHQIVRRHGGRILVDSEVGRGTVVSVRLPPADGDDADAGKPPAGGAAGR
jgi:signal transduction histidine kinase